MPKNYGFSGASAEELREAYEIFNAHLKQNQLKDLIFRGPLREPEMKKAFKKLALIYHPDRNPDNEAAMEERQKQVFNAFNVFKNYFAEHEVYDPSTYKAPLRAQIRYQTRPSQDRPRQSNEDQFWKKNASLKKDQEFIRSMEQYLAEIPPAELEVKLKKSFELCWKLLEQSGNSPLVTELQDIKARRLATRYNLQAELSYAQRRYDKAKLEYLQEAIFLIWEAAYQSGFSVFDEKLLASSVKAALQKSAKSAHYDGKGNMKALWLLSAHVPFMVAKVHEKLDLPNLHRFQEGDELQEEEPHEKKSILNELSDWGNDLKHTVFNGIRKIINR